MKHLHTAEDGIDWFPKGIRFIYINLMKNQLKYKITYLLVTWS